MKNKILITILTVLISVLLPIGVFAQTTNTTEDERTQILEQALAITIPTETDNPNHIITFKDPSKKGVKVEIDGQGFKTVKSPYSLPSLGIGSHLLSFRFTDTQQTTQTLDKTIVIIPRPPVVSAPTTISKSKVSLTGTSLAGSTVELFLVGDTINMRSSTVANAEGDWTYDFKGDFKYTVYTIIARTKKNGFSSNITEPVVFEISQANKPDTNTNEKQAIFFNFGSITIGNIFETIKANPHLIILVASSILLGVIIALLIDSLSLKKNVKKAEGKFLNLLNRKEKFKKRDEKIEEEEKKMTLREKFERAGLKVKDEKIEEKPKEEVMSKEEFMKENKDKDPDNDKLKEPKLEKKEESKEKEPFTLLGKVKKD
jgi:hypothetical protein